MVIPPKQSITPSRDIVVPDDVIDLRKELLLPYQQDWVADQSRYKMGMWSRQTGKSYGTGFEAVEDCVIDPLGDKWVCMSVGERQALEWLEKCKDFARAWKLVVDSYDETRGAANALLKSAEVRFSNGRRIIAIPALPRTARGYSGKVVLDEFAFHEDPRGVWGAIYPSISNPLTGIKCLRIVSTPNGKDNKFYQLWTGDNDYSKHMLTIYDAVKRGLPVDPEALKKNLDDAELWQQEFLCQFIDASAVLLPYEMISSCESETLYSVVDASTKLYAGYDVGRKKDLGVYWEIAETNGTSHTTEVKVFEKRPFSEQREFLESRLPFLHRLAIDATGLGMNLAEDVAKKAPSKVMECMFSAKLKSEIFPRMKSAFEDRTVRIPTKIEIREDLHAIHKISGAGGRVSFHAPSTKDGHSDRATALALALHAGAETGGSTVCESINIHDHIGASSYNASGAFRTGSRFGNTRQGML